MPEYGPFVSDFCSSASCALEGAMASWVRIATEQIDLLADACLAHQGEGARRVQRLAPLFKEVSRRLRMAQVLATGGWGSAALATLQPGIECTLFAGKLADDFDNLSIISARATAPHQYTRTFAGLQIISRSLPASGSLQAASAFITKLLSEIAPEICTLPVGASGAATIGEYDSQLSDAVCLSCAHLSLLITAELIALAESISSLQTGLSVKAQISEFEADYAKLAAEYGQISPRHEALLRIVGMWAASGAPSTTTSRNN